METTPYKNNIQEIIALLNNARRMELSSIHQYMIQHYALDDMNYGGLASGVRRVAIDEMRHAETFAERIRELGGEPVTDLDVPIEHGQSIEAMFAFDREAETTTMARYNEYVAICARYGDHVTKQLFERILVVEQEHWNYFDDTDIHIGQLGKVFLARMAGGSSD